jgi:hypothetical protein
MSPPRHPPMSAHLLPAWLAAECQLWPTHFETAGALYRSWCDFAQARHAEPGSPADFADRMEARGFTRDQLAGDRNRIRWGLRLRRPSTLGGGAEKLPEPLGATPPVNAQKTGALFGGKFFLGGSK